VKLWIDECLSPTLVARANHRGYWATCNRDRDLLGVADQNLHELVIDEEAVFVDQTLLQRILALGSSSERDGPVFESIHPLSALDKTGIAR
jgi:hypothetical protein